ncbi:sodium-dependent glucose transporter 1A-like [Saccoglossus kowalevskii]
MEIDVNNVVHENKVERVVNKPIHKILLTFLLYAAFLGLGMCVGVLGPSLIDLQLQVGVGVDTIALIFTAGGAGYMTGSVIGGICFDRFENQILLGVSLLGLAVSVFVIPWCNSFALLIVVNVLLTVSEGIIDTGANVVGVNLWKNKSGSYMQALHFIFAVGATISPMIAGPFLTSPPHQSDLVVNSSYDVSMTMQPSTSVIKMNTKIEGKLLPTTRYTFGDGDDILRVLLETTTPIVETNNEFERDIENATSAKEENYHTNYTFDNGIIYSNDIITQKSYISQLWIPYTIIALYNFTVAVSFCMLFCKGSRNLRIRKERPLYCDANNRGRRKQTRRFRFTLLGLLVIFFGLYAGQEVVFGNFVYTYAMGSPHGFTTQTASYLNSLFWGLKGDHQPDVAHSNVTH